MTNQDHRAIAMKLVARAEGDAAFREHVRRDPLTAVRDAGIPEDVAQSLLRGPVDEARPLDCMDFTCWSSECPGTCYVSFWGLAPAAETGREPGTEERRRGMPDTGDTGKVVLTQSQLKLVEAALQIEIERATGEGVRILDEDLAAAKNKYAKYVQLVLAAADFLTNFIGAVAPEDPAVLRRTPRPAGSLSLDELIEARRQLEEDFNRAAPRRG